MRPEIHFIHKHPAHITEERRCKNKFFPEENKFSNKKEEQHGRKNNFGQKNMGDLRSTAKSPEDKSLNVWNKVSGQKRFYKPQRPEGVDKQEMRSFCGENKVMKT